MTVFLSGTLAAAERGTLGLRCSSSALKLRRLTESGETPEKVRILLIFRDFFFFSEEPDLQQIKVSFAGVLYFVKIEIGGWEPSCYR